MNSIMMKNIRSIVIMSLSFVSVVAWGEPNNCNSELAARARAESNASQNCKVIIHASQLGVGHGEVGAVDVQCPDPAPNADINIETVTHYSYKLFPGSCKIAYFTLVPAPVFVDPAPSEQNK